MKVSDKYAHQKRYLRHRYATDEAYRGKRRLQARERRAARYGDAVFRGRERLAQWKRYAAEAALQSMKYLFEAPPPQKRRAARGVDSRLLDFCRQFLARNG